MANKFHILALSGGGFRGLYTATVLAKLEDKCEVPIGKCFDLICGTSIGGIIALAIACEVPMKDIVKMFINERDKIFPKRLFRKFRILCTSKYDNDGLKTVLTNLFGDKQISDLKHRVLIPTINFTKGSGQYFKTQHNPEFHVDGSKKLIDIAMATSAAPLFYPMYKNTGGIYADGGLLANAPGFHGLHEATKFLNIRKEDVTLLSIGTLSKKLTARANEKLDAGLWQWRERLLLLTLSAQEASTDYMLKHHLGTQYYSIDSELTEEQANGIGIDTTTNDAVDLLRQRGEISYQEFIGTEFSHNIVQHRAQCPQFYN